jgi:FKBP-type peptidyl-prolyl cis-trans isomerase
LAPTKLRFQESPMNRIVWLLLALALFTLPHIACQDSATDVATTASPTPPAATPAAAPGEMRTTPSGLKYQDLIGGAGRRVLWGQMVTVKYVGKLADGKVFDADKFDFKLGDATVIKGFNLGIGGGDGIEAMKVDGKRVIVVPPELGYGAAGDGRKIPPNATLTFELELLKAQGGLGF